MTKLEIDNFLSCCKSSDKMALFDSAQFNDISIRYVRMAVERLTEKGIIDDDQALAVRNEVSYLYDTKRAAELYTPQELRDMN